MAILHYTIGLPPTRNGGSVHYAYSLIMEQARTEEVLVLISGDTLFRGNTAKIKKKGALGSVEVFELRNPLTPTLIYGTGDPEKQHRDIRIDYDNIRRFIENHGITVMHLHTLMGMHSKIVEFVKGLGVRIVYTTHDFHGICLHYDFINPKRELCHNVDPARCAVCNLREPSDMFLRLANSSIYHKLKKAGAFKILKQPKVASKAASPVDTQLPEVSKERVGEYEKLIAYYKDYFKLVDKFHFNSRQTEQLFKKFVPFAQGAVMPVITEGITDNRQPLSISKSITFGFVGNHSEYKGFPMLKKALTELMAEGYEGFRLMAYVGDRVGTDPECSAILYQPPYKYSEISSVMNGLDCLIIPSKLYETFSLVGLEALAHGRPVIVSDRVGIKDIVANYEPDMIFDSPEELKQLLILILKNPEILTQYNAKIRSKNWNFSIGEHTYQMLDFYESQP